MELWESILFSKSSSSEYWSGNSSIRLHVLPSRIPIEGWIELIRNNAKKRFKLEASSMSLEDSMSKGKEG
jgi:hypothetical protein